MTVPAPDPDAAAAPAARLAEAMREHQEGNFEAADVAYRSALAARPDDPDTLHFYGMLRYQRGEADAGIALVERALALDPANPHAWNNLGNMYIQLHRDADAEHAYRRATRLDTPLASAWYNLARIYARDRKLEQALECLRNITRVSRGFVRALQMLGQIYYQLGQRDAAREVYEQWAREVPDDPTPRHMLAAYTGQVPDRADDRYIVKTFDSFADSFDQALERLDYSAPQLVAARLAQHRLYLTGTAALLDAGCGTGWCGPLLRSTAGHLVGVDLSPGMLERAKARGVYDELHAGELTAFMAARTAAFDIIVAADVLCYFGRLDEAIQAAAGALRPGGLLCFSVEVLGEEGSGEDFRIGSHGRYAHARAYLERVAVAAGFLPPEIDRAVLRQELGRPVDGYIVSARRADA